MKKSLILSLSLAFLLSACKKDHGDDSNPANTWNFKGTEYTAATIVYVNGGSAANLSATATGATATSADGLTFVFSTPPASSGQMLITDSGDPNTVLVSISKLSGTTTTFYLNQETNVMANVAINNGKISVSFPGSIWLHNLANSNDSAQLSAGTITQQ
jgi:hypothetical protein